MKGIAGNLLLALVWAGLVGEMSAGQITVGFILGFAVLWIGQDLLGTESYVTRGRKVFGLAVFLVWEIIKANLKVAYDVVTPTHRSRPAVVAVPLELTTDLEITLFATMVSLTPGSLSLDLSEDRKVLFVHGMFVDDPEKLKRALKDGFERRLLEAMR